LKNGDFSAYANVIKIYDPLTGTFSGGNVTNRTQFKDNKIPIDRINPVAKAVMAFWGAPKHGAQGNFLLNNNIRDSTLAELLDPPYRNYTIRLDHSIGDNDKLFGRYSWYNRKSSYNNYTDSIYVGDRFIFASKQAVVDEVHTFNANSVLNLRYGFNRFVRAPMHRKGNMGWTSPRSVFRRPSTMPSAKASGVSRVLISLVRETAPARRWVMAIRMSSGPSVATL
jgi:hypothetical protein